MNIIDQFYHEIDLGKEGNNLGIPTGFPLLDWQVPFAKRSYVVLFADTSVGKSSFAQEAWMLNPIERLMAKDRKYIGKNFKFLYFSLERNVIDYMAKWVSRTIFKKKNITIPHSDVFSRRQIIEDEKRALMLDERSYLEDLLQYVQVIDTLRKPDEIHKYITNFFKENGTITKENNRTIYVPNDPNTLYVIMIDHAIKIEPENGDSPKQAIDKMSHYCQEYSAIYNAFVVFISQSNRDTAKLRYGNVKGGFEPELNHIMHTSGLAQDADVVMSLFNPYDYRLEEFYGWSIPKMVIDDRFCNFRSLRIHKNTFGSTSRIPFAFLGSSATFRELHYKPTVPHPNSDDDNVNNVNPDIEELYEEIRTGRYFNSQTRID